MSSPASPTAGSVTALPQRESIKRNAGNKKKKPHHPNAGSSSVAAITAEITKPDMPPASSVDAPESEKTKRTRRNPAYIPRAKRPPVAAEEVASNEQASSPTNKRHPTPIGQERRAAHEQERPVVAPSNVSAHLIDEAKRLDSLLPQTVDPILQEKMKMIVDVFPKYVDKPHIVRSMLEIHHDDPQLVINALLKEDSRPTEPAPSVPASNSLPATAAKGAPFDAWNALGRPADAGRLESDPEFKEKVATATKDDKVTERQKQWAENLEIQRQKDEAARAKHANKLKSAVSDVTAATNSLAALQVSIMGGSTTLANLQELIAKALADVQEKMRVLQDLQAEAEEIQQPENDEVAQLMAQREELTQREQHLNEELRQVRQQISSLDKLLAGANRAKEQRVMELQKKSAAALKQPDQPSQPSAPAKQPYGPRHNNQRNGEHDQRSNGHGHSNGTTANGQAYPRRQQDNFRAQFSQERPYYKTAWAAPSSASHDEHRVQNGNGGNVDKKLKGKNPTDRVKSKHGYEGAEDLSRE